ncbi:MAG: methyltransferase domain-containing protein [Nitrospirae bacterium]|nr:methyltransferase domain-containing protein [Nitrospirota bacterium]
MNRTISKNTEKLKNLWGGFRASRVLLTANNYRIFDYLIRPASAASLSKKLRTDLRATGMLLDALTGLGIIKKQGSKYLNSPLASEFLVSGKPYYQGDIIRHADTMWKNWSALDKAIKTGKPCREARNHESFILGMHNLSVLKAKDVLKKIGLIGAKKALDLGGGPGTYSMEMAKKGIFVTLFDRPETIEIAKKAIEKAKVKGINFIEGNFLEDDIGRGYDLILISQVLHSYSDRENLMLLRKCKKALNKSGRIVIQEFKISKDMTYPPQSALFSVNMLVNTDAGRCYSPEEIKGWLKKIRMKKITEKLVDDSVLIEGLG